jgi:hypothetical protein
MAKPKVKLQRTAPRRTLTKKQAIRHLIHCAGRMFAAREDPFAIHLQIQSADKLLIDLAKKRKRPLVFSWDELIKPEYRKAVIESIRETSNFFKHADKDHDSTLHVGDIARMNILHIGICVVNYHDFFGELTDHMKLLFSVARLVSPESFVQADQRLQFNAALPQVEDMTLAQYLGGWWDDPLLKTVLPNLELEKAEDLQDTLPLYDQRISKIQSG